MSLNLGGTRFQPTDNNNFETYGFRLGNLTSDPSDGLPGSAYYNSISNSLKIKTNLGWEDYFALASLNALNASNLTSGTVPLGRLSGITTTQLSATAGILGTQLSATAGILSSQITSLDASKLAGTVDNARLSLIAATIPALAASKITTGTFSNAFLASGIDAAKLTTGQLPVGRLNGGNSTQFVRGDGTYSNTLTAAFVATGTGTFSGDLIRVTSSSGTGGYLRTNTTAGADDRTIGLIAADAIDVSRTGYVLCRGINAPSNAGGVDIRPCTAGGQTRLLFANGLPVLSVDTAMTLGPFTGSTATFSGQVIFNGASSLRAQVIDLVNTCRINYGAAGTTTAANSEIVGAVGGLRYNVGSGLSHTFLVANTAALTVSATGLAVVGGCRVTTSTKTTTYTATASDYVLICNHATVPFTVTLPAATGTGQVLFLKNIGAAAVTVDANASETIDGSLTQVLALNNSIQIVDYASGVWSII